jgi:hypothetical protein
MPGAMHQALRQAMHVRDADKTRQDKTTETTTTHLKNSLPKSK